MKVLTWDELAGLQNALSDLTGYIGDNSCSDPDCCGGPYFSRAEFETAEQVLAGYGLKWNGSTD